MKTQRKQQNGQLGSLKTGQRNFLLECLEYALQHNLFYYNTHYKQNTGIAMGAKFAPSAVNLFMLRCEEDTNQGQDN